MPSPAAIGQKPESIERDGGEDLVFSTREVVAKWLRMEAAIAVSKLEAGIVISPELALHVATLLSIPTPLSPHRL